MNATPSPTTNANVPEWARQRAANIVNEATGMGWTAESVAIGMPHEADVMRTFAAYIATHEEAPLDPLDKAIGDAFDRLPEYWDRNSFVASLGKTLREHGAEIVEASK